MNKMLVAVFKDEGAAYKGLSALKSLHSQGDISVYATAVIVKDASGAVSVKQSADEGPVGTSLGMLTGSLVGLLAGPIGMVAGASLGGLTGILFDVNKAGVDLDFLDEVASVLSPGKTAVLADVEEEWAAPVDTKIREIGGLVFRRLRSEVIDDQLARENAAYEAELKELEDELAQAKEEHKEAVQKEIDEVKEKINLLHSKAKERVMQLKKDRDAKIESLKSQMGTATGRQKAKLEKRIADVTADFDARRAKLRQAAELTKEALAA